MTTSLLTNAAVAAMTPESPYGLIADGAIAIENGRIAWTGARASLPERWMNEAEHDLGGRLVTPSLVDCHTHLVFGGNRAREFEMRLEGASYEEIAQSGGGILSTVQATRAASEEDLVEAALPRLDALICEGVSTIEIKSGYGLDQSSELKMLRAARQLGKLRPVRVFTSYLGAHAVPPEYSGDADGYIDEVCIPALREAAKQGLVDYVDGFCERIAFTPAQISRVFDAARSLELPVRLHAEQLSWQGGVELAAQYGALCVDHVEYAKESDAAAMAGSGSVATLLPGAFYTLHETQAPPVDAFRKHGVPMAVATDANPGSSPLFSPLLAMNMACTLFGTTPEEALRGTTLNAARALGLKDTGMIAPGMRADLAVWNASHPAELSYMFGFNPLHERWFEGVLS